MLPPPLLLLVLFPSHSFALSRPRWIPLRRADASIPKEGYINPVAAGKSMLTRIPWETYPAGQGEPLNMIVSGNSDADVLVDQEDGGLQTYFTSLNFSGECLNQQMGNPMQADLADGDGLKNQTAVIRYNYGDPALGTCKESIQGGNHFRYWLQDGPTGNTGAVFLATSYEKPLVENHDIVLNGYNLGRDYIVGNISGTVIPTLNLTTASTYEGSSSYKGYTYHTKVTYVAGMLSNSSIGVNHNESVRIDGVVNAVDGLVAVLDVQIVERPEKSDDGAISITLDWTMWTIMTTIVGAFTLL
ncbi:hypothetical protein CYLTODRAFT_450734 [Cylindrobasidium torrendii FP15055 ss-10]|uniref:Uncharacterized protein n=1 Tax=Cylindrobasidium torrendii FP15055 ss-10 TaxID=1314674 RepID=A0A0D7BM66_9AGAR|nr:hypothetical protein CYLTODRAFT_450734 [Cylindrobasidium torrendii FP15055 ss-10]